MIILTLKDRDDFSSILVANKDDLNAYYEDANTLLSYWILTKNRGKK